METSREAWEAASNRHQEARLQVKRLRDALAAADDALEYAEWDLRQHEASPGIPLYSHVSTS